MSMSEAEDVLATAAAWRAAGEQVALATVTETWGSSPRPAGSQMAVTKSGRMAGSVSGGCIEGAVADAAMSTIADRHAATAGFRHHQRARLGGRAGLRRQGEGVRGAAGMTPAMFAALTAARAAKAPGGAGDAAAGRRAVLLPDPAAPADAGRGRAAARCATTQRHGQHSPTATWFLHAYNPPLRLVVVGAVHIAQALVPMAAQLGLAVDGGRSAPRLRLRRAVSRRHRQRRLAGRGDGRAGARCAHRGGDADARPQAGRPGAGPGAAQSRHSISARWAAGAPMRPGSRGCARSAMTRRRWRASAARSGWTSRR